MFTIIHELRSRCAQPVRVGKISHRRAGSLTAMRRIPRHNLHVLNHFAKLMNIDARFGLRQFAMAAFGARGAKVESIKTTECGIFPIKPRLPSAGWATFGVPKSCAPQTRPRNSCSHRNLRQRLKNTSAPKSPRVHLSQNPATPKISFPKPDLPHFELRTPHLNSPNFAT
jgi:hypothetical protein